MPTAQKLPSGKWRGQARVAGFKAESKTFDSQRDALSWATAREEQLRLKRAVEKASVAIAEAEEGEKPRLLFREAAALYFESRQFEKKPANTKRGEKKASKHPLAELGGEEVHSMDNRTLRKYRDTMLARKSPRTGDFYKEDSVRLHMAFISSVFNFLNEHQDYNLANPVRGVKKPKGKSRNARITPLQEAYIFDVLTHYSKEVEDDDGEAYMFYWMLLALGCRPGELAELKLEAINIEKNQIFLEKTKNTNARTIVVNEQDMQHLVSWLKRDSRPKDCQFVFPWLDRKYKIWVPYRYAEPWKVIKKKVGHLLDPATVPHLFRHERISRWYEETEMSDAQIAVLSGHLSLAALHKYAHIRAEKLRKHIDSVREKDDERLLSAWTEQALIKEAGQEIKPEAHKPIEQQLKESPVKTRSF
ncbi:tyrosine-type recombinase/integrase [Azospira sp. APE16]|uniref:tyrosine-type recombinase/integrase n=1 Tax=Azospira sp. APE16 TaxID=3394231 RepID=UPI003A4D82C9